MTETPVTDERVARREGPATSYVPRWSAKDDDARRARRERVRAERESVVTEEREGVALDLEPGDFVDAVGGKVTGGGVYDPVSDPVYDDVGGAEETRLWRTTMYKRWQVQDRVADVLPVGRTRVAVRFERCGEFEMSQSYPVRYRRKV
jgi:hypothetical protein